MLQQDHFPYRSGDEPQNSPVLPLSVDDFLYSLERSPTPARFERRRQRLMRGRPRLPRMRAIGRSRTSYGMRIEHFVEMAQLAIPHHSATNTVAEANEESGEGDLRSSQVFKKGPLNDVQSIQMVGDQREENCEYQEASVLGLTDTSFTNSLFTPEDPIEPPSLGVFDQECAIQELEDNVCLIPTRLPRSVGQLQVYKAKHNTLQYRNVQKALGPRQAPVDQLVLILDHALPIPEKPTSQTPSEQASNDTAKQSGNTPCSRSGKSSAKRHTTSKVIKRRKQFYKLQLNVSKTTSVELADFRLPKGYRIARSSKGRPRTMPSCSDGFEGSEIEPTGRTMPVKRLRKTLHTAKPAFAINCELTLVPYRCFGDDTEQSNSHERVSTSAQEQSHTYPNQHSTACLTIGQTINPTDRVEKMFCDGEVSGPILVVDGVYQPAALATLRVQSPSIKSRAARRVTFSDTIENQQRLTVVSAPIVAKYYEDNGDESSDEEREKSVADTADDETSNVCSEESGDSGESNSVEKGEENEEDEADVQDGAYEEESIDPENQ